MSTMVHIQNILEKSGLKRSGDKRFGDKRSGLARSGDKRPTIAQSIW
jgi:hypothetical protein